MRAVSGNTKLSFDFVCSLQNGYQCEGYVKRTMAGEMFTMVLAFGGACSVPGFDCISHIKLKQSVTCECCDK